MRANGDRAPSSSGFGWEAVLAVQPDEPGLGENPAPRQPVGRSFEQNHLLVPARPDRLHEATARPELLHQRWRNRGKRR